MSFTVKKKKKKNVVKGKPFKQIYLTDYIDK